jgi:DNA-binding MarR family transcriptional regulator
MENINEIIHQPVRLKILSLLYMDKSITFSNLKKELELTDWNLWIHLERLEKAWYIKIEKSFVNKKPQSLVSILKEGENELIKYMQAIENLFKWIK